MADQPGAWSRPDLGVDPEDYVGDKGGNDQRAPSGDDANADGDAASGGEDELSPGRSVVDDGDDDAVEPNEPG